MSRGGETDIFHFVVHFPVHKVVYERMLVAGQFVIFLNRSPIMFLDPGSMEICGGYEEVLTAEGLCIYLESFQMEVSL